MKHKSKQAQAKEDQGYLEKPTPRICSNCNNYSSDWRTHNNFYQEEVSKKCVIGGFAVKKTATCEKFELEV